MGRGRVTLSDWAIAIGVTASLLVAALSEPRPAITLDPLGFALLLTGGLALAAGRVAPVIVLAVAGASALGYLAAGFQVPAVAFLVALFAAMRAGRRFLAATAAAVMLAGVPLVVWGAARGASLAEAVMQSRDILPLAWLVAAGAAGEALRQAERRADEAERSREEPAQRRADEERLHIARELHDSLTHQISVIKVQAEVAVHLAQKNGEPISEALLAIREAGREASGELRRTLQALRDDHHILDPDNPAGSTSLPGLDQVPELVRRARSSGLDASLSIAGHRRDVPAAVDQTAYRILQESLTNVARHAAASTASVKIDYRPEALVIRVVDDGTATLDAVPVPGVGLRGMRERVAVLGGRLRAAPHSEGGFTVEAELPLDCVNLDRTP